MANLLKRRSNVLVLMRAFSKTKVKDTQRSEKGVKLFLADSLKGMNVHPDSKQIQGLKYAIFGTLFCLEMGESMGHMIGVYAGFQHFIRLVEEFDREKGNKVTSYIIENLKERERKQMIGTGLGQGLAWFHYANHLQNVLAVDIKTEVEQSEWFKSLSTDERGRISMKMYEIIPRKCYVDIPGTDDNIQYEASVTVDKKNKTTLQIYSIKDGQKKYYCICNCPRGLKTINNVNDIQLAGIASSKHTTFVLPWNRNSKIQLFTEDTRLVQLMRFYYALSSLLCLNNKQDAVRLILFNESEKKLSNVLLHVIKQDLNVSSIQKECSSSERLAKVGAVKQDADNQSKMPSLRVDGPQIRNMSLMEKTLLSGEECKDIYYDFDVFVTHQQEVQGNGMDKKKELQNIVTALKKRNMKILTEGNCVGKDWLTKLKYAATKCRWIVFVDTQQSNSKLFISHKVTDSLNRILDSRKVQTLAIVNPKDDMHIFNGLRWVTCIPNTKNTINILCKVVSGLDIKLESSTDLYHKPGDVAVGLAWFYAATHLNWIVRAKSKKQEISHDGKKMILPKLYIIVPESCITHGDINKANSLTDPRTPYSHRCTIPGSPQEYKIFDGDKEPSPEEISKSLESVKYCRCEYPRAVDVIRQMNEKKILNEKQMKLEVEKFYKTVDRIMEILLPEITDNYEFVYYDDTKTTLRKVLFERIQTEALMLRTDHIASLLSPFEMYM